MDRISLSHIDFFVEQTDNVSAVWYWSAGDKLISERVAVLVAAGAVDGEQNKR